MDLMDYRRKIIANSPHLSHAEGAVATFADGTDLPLKSLLVDIDPVQSGTGDPSPSNIRPIIGKSTASVTRCGKNLINVRNVSLPMSENSFCAVNFGRDVTFSNLKISFVAENVTFTNTSGAMIDYRKKDGSHQYRTAQSTGMSANTNNTGTYVKSETNITFCELYLFMGSGYSAFTGGTISVQFEIGASATTYEPYQGQSITAQLGQTVYGGTLNPLTGVLTVDRYLYVYDGTESFSKSGTALNGFYNNLALNILPHNWPSMLNYNNDNTPISSEVSSMFRMTRTVNTYKQNYGYCFLDSGMNFNCNPDVFGTTVDTFKAKLAELYANGTPVSVFAKLATPIEIQLTPQQVRSLYGSNTIFADTGNVVALEYWAHP